jgi:acyl-coenzyme A synthetase/AMP-(fatty) acid ligase
VLGAQNDLKTIVFTELNKVTQTSLEEIKFVKKISKTENGKIRPTLVG